MTRRWTECETISLLDIQKRPTRSMLEGASLKSPSQSSRYFRDGSKQHADLRVLSGHDSESELWALSAERWGC